VRLRAFTLAAVLALAAPFAAQAATSAESAGYVASAKGVHFRLVDAFWKIPKVTCSPPHRSYSAMWVGIGGFGSSASATAMSAEVGTEADCSYTGKEVTSVWYALLPGASTPVHIATAPGDVVSGSISESGGAVTFTLREGGSRASFVKTVRVRRLDDASAEWLLGPPSACISATACQPLPLANFGSAAFGVAYAKSSSGVIGSISDRAWHAAAVSLIPVGALTSSARPGAPFASGAVPSPLGALGTAFTIGYRKLAISSNPFA
jgi:hypothetical protein